LLAKPMPANEVLALFTAACPATKSLGQGHSLPEAD
jgi:hypothetical protein